jgi:hypothetical protein
MTAPFEDIPIATIEKNAREQFRILLRKFQGGRPPLVELAVFEQAESGRIFPTAKQVWVRLDHLPFVIDALRDAQRKAGEPSS